MKKGMFFYSTLCVLTAILICVSCQNSDVEKVDEPESTGEVRGWQEYRQALTQLSQRSVSRSNDQEVSKEDIKQLVEISRGFLLQNDITCNDLNMENDDELIAVVAMALLDYQQSIDPESRTTFGGCVIEALGVKEIISSAGRGATKHVAKAVAKVALKRAVPWLGWGMFAWDLAACYYE